MIQYPNTKKKHSTIDKWMILSFVVHIRFLYRRRHCSQAFIHLLNFSLTHINVLLHQKVTKISILLVQFLTIHSIKSEHSLKTVVLKSINSIAHIRIQTNKHTYYTSNFDKNILTINLDQLPQNYWTFVLFFSSIKFGFQTFVLSVLFRVSPWPHDFRVWIYLQPQKQKSFVLITFF